MPFRCAAYARPGIPFPGGESAGWRHVLQLGCWCQVPAARGGAPRGGEDVVPGQIPAGEIHHLRLTVTDVQRSREFCTSLLGF